MLNSERTQDMLHSVRPSKEMLISTCLHMRQLLLLSFYDVLSANSEEPSWRHWDVRWDLPAAMANIWLGADGWDFSHGTLVPTKWIMVEAAGVLEPWWSLFNSSWLLTFTTLSDRVPGPNGGCERSWVTITWNSVPWWVEEVQSVSAGAVGKCQINHMHRL